MLTSLAFILSFTTSCDLIDQILGGEGKCGEDVEVYEMRYDVGVTCVNTGITPIAGMRVDLDVWKEHCDGPDGRAPGFPYISEVRAFDGAVEGPVGTSSYTMKTEKDRICCSIKLYGRGENKDKVIAEDGASYSYWDCVNRITPTFDKFIFTISEDGTVTVNHRGGNEGPYGMNEIIEEYKFSYNYLAYAQL